VDEPRTGVSAPLGERGTAPPLTAYRVNRSMAMPLVPASREREWMEATDRRFALRCLPLLVANQAGWFLLSAHTVRATWAGGKGAASLRVELLGGDPPCPAVSHFGHGILTWHVPYLFRTAPGYNLLVRGPANWPRDGACPLEGLVEADWSYATFTMNWQVTRRRCPVTFAAGDPIAMLVPQRRGELEAFRPEIRDIERSPAVREPYEEWAEDRAWFNSELRRPGSEARRQEWQKHYFQGSSPVQARVPGHQTRLSLAEFADRGPEDG